MFLISFARINRSSVLIVTIVPWFSVAVAAIAAACHGLAPYYRASARELKRLDAILRPPLYAHFSESLTGLAAIRAYGETERFQKESEDQMNIESRFFLPLPDCVRHIDPPALGLTG
jgi:ABC-type multidrug transport system fused ATPase/permease subunit